MGEVAPIAERISRLVERRNRELASDAALKAGLGVAFSLLTFGVFFWFSWVIGFMVSALLSLYAWQFAAILTGLFFVVTVWSAWRRVDPLAELTPMTDEEWMLTMLSQATGAFLYFSPRHATAGAALILLGGPVAVFESLGIWAHRLPADPSLIEEAAKLLVRCDKELSAEEVRVPAAAFLLRRLALIKVVPHGESAALALTDKGFALHAKRKPQD
jgi:hypothetical protein